MPGLTVKPPEGRRGLVANLKAYAITETLLKLSVQDEAELSGLVADGRIFITADWLEEHGHPREWCWWLGYSHQPGMTEVQAYRLARQRWGDSAQLRIDESAPTREEKSGLHPDDYRLRRYRCKVHLRGSSLAVREGDTWEEVFA